MSDALGDLRILREVCEKQFGREGPLARDLKDRLDRIETALTGQVRKTISPTHKTLKHRWSFTDPDDMKRYVSEPE